MSVDFNAVARFLATIAARYTQEGKLIPPEQSPDFPLLCLTLGIWWIPSCPEVPHGAYHCTDEAAAELLAMAQNGNAGAWDIASNISAHRLGTDDSLPEALRYFSARVLSGRLPRPKSPRRNQTWLRAQFIYMLVNMAHYGGNLNRTRTDEKKGAHDSACDAVEVALTKSGHFAPTYRAIKEICIGSKPENVRLRHEHHLWVAALAQVAEHDPDMARALPGVAGEYWRSVEGGVTDI